jgi:hypothetical protein
MLSRNAAEDAMRAVVNRLNILPADADASLRTKLATERDKQSRRQGQLHQLLSHLNQWVTEQPASVKLDCVAPATVELKNGVKLSTELDNVRDQIKAARQHLEAIKRAPLPLADQKQLAEDYVVRLMQAAQPTVNVVGDRLRVGYRGDMAAAEDVLALIAWATPDALLRALERQLAAAPMRTDALPAKERQERVSQLTHSLLQLERREEALVSMAASEGIEILRRPDADPCAVLGCAVVT